MCQKRLPSHAPQSSLWIETLIKIELDLLCETHMRPGSKKHFQCELASSRASVRRDGVVGGSGHMEVT